MEDKLGRTIDMIIRNCDDLGDIPLGIVMSELYELEPWFIERLRPEELN